MSRIRIIKKNDEYSSEYEVGDIFETTGTWYGGVHVEGKSGVPVSLDREEYEDLDADTKAGTDSKTTIDPKTGIEATTDSDAESQERDIRTGDIVKHFKREWEPQGSSKYLYKVLAFAEHTETGEKLAVYQALYAPFKICARPYSMFMGEVDREKYPQAKQRYRFEKLEPEAN